MINGTQYVNPRVELYAASTHIPRKFRCWMWKVWLRLPTSMRRRVYDFLTMLAKKALEWRHHFIRHSATIWCLHKKWFQRSGGSCRYPICWGEHLSPPFLISSIAFPPAILNIRGWVSSSCRPFQGIIFGRGAKSYTSSQNNSRISLLKHYKDGLNNYGLCLPRTYHFRLSRRWFIQFQDPRHSRRTFKTIPLSAWVPPRRLLHPMGIWQ